MSATVEHFGARVRLARRELKLSQRALAEKAQITQASVSNYEQGERLPPLGLAVNLATALDVPLCTLIGEHEGAE